MSTIGVTYHNEDIHNVIKTEEPPVIKSPMPKSTHNKYKDNGQKFGHKTFGFAHYELPTPSDYLKKNSRIHPVPFVDEDDKKCTQKTKKPDVPGRKIAKKPCKEEKDYLCENSRWVGCLAPPKAKHKLYDKETGDEQDMSYYMEGLKMLTSEDYGKLPKYLCERMKKWEREREMMKRACEEQRGKKGKMGAGQLAADDNYVMVDPEERNKLLDGLKKNWDDLMKQYKVLPVMCDTLPKINRKIFLEKELNNLEKDIALIEKHPNIYLPKDAYRSIKQATEVN